MHSSMEPGRCSTPAQWRQALDGLTRDELDQVGRSQMPYGWDPKVRFIDLLAWTNTELTHHAAEIGCLRDLYRVRDGRMFGVGPERGL